MLMILSVNGLYWKRDKRKPVLRTAYNLLKAGTYHFGLKSGAAPVFWSKYTTICTLIESLSVSLTFMRVLTSYNYPIFGIL